LYIEKVDSKGLTTIISIKQKIHFVPIMILRLVHFLQFKINYRFVSKPAKNVGRSEAPLVSGKIGSFLTHSELV